MTGRVEPRSLASRALLPLVLLALGVCSSACTPTPERVDRDVEAFATRCESDTECGELRECRLGACGVIGASREIVLSFSPPEVRGDLAPQSVIGVTAVTGASLPDYALQPAVSVFGQISFDDAPGVENLSARGIVTLTPSIRVPGALGSVSFFTDADGRLHDELVQAGAVTRVPRVRLAPGTYDATVLLTRNRAPSRTFRSLSVSGLETDLAFQLPSTISLQRINGDVSLPRVELDGVAGAMVTAISPDGRVSEAVTSSDGSFFVFVDEDITELDFRVSAATPGISARFERVSVAELDDNDVQLVLPREPEFVPLRIDASSASGTRPSGSSTVRWTQQLETSSTGVSASPGITSGTLTQQIDVDISDGLALGVVYAGLGVATLAPADSAFGLPASQQLFLSGVNDPVLTFQLPLRQVVSGGLEDPDTEAPTPGAQVSAVLVQTPDGRPPSLNSRSFGASAFADSTGRFEISLQPGLYDVFAQPPANEGSAALTRVSLEVVEGEQTVWRIPAVRSGVVAGRLLDAEGEAIVGAAVEVWPVEGAGERPLAQSSTNEAGVYTLLLPVP